MQKRRRFRDSFLVDIMLALLIFGIPVLVIARPMYRNAKMDAEADIIVTAFLREYSGQLEQAYEIMLPYTVGIADDLIYPDRILRFSSARPEGWDAEAYALIDEAAQALVSMWRSYASGTVADFALRRLDKTGEWYLDISIVTLSPRVERLSYSSPSSEDTAQADAAKLPPGWRLHTGLL
jgi:hypothetical protein